MQKPTRSADEFRTKLAATAATAGQEASVISSLTADSDSSADANQQSSKDADDDNSQEDTSNQQYSPSRKLKFQTVALSGRSQEFSLLRECYKRISGGSYSNSRDGDKGNSKAKSETVLITGDSGSGKSKLAGALREPVSLEGNGFFVSGKFDQIRNEPYGALVEAFTDLCDLVSQQKSEECGTIAETLKDEVSVLRKVIPNLATITSPTTTMSESSEGKGVINGKDSFTRLKLSCRKFLNAIASEKHPVVLHIDDLQWADKASIEVLQSLATDTDSEHILIIGTQRHGTISTAQPEVPFNNILHPSETAEAVFTLPCTTIHLDNFDLDQVTELISNLLEMPRSETVELAELILKRTDGLPFSAVNFMEMLKARRLLVFDKVAIKWGWYIPKIQAKTMASDNVVNVVAARLQKINQQSQYILQLASLQGFQFDPEILKALATKENATLKKNTTEGNLTMQVDKALQIATWEGLIEKIDDGSFKFCHDRIRGCLYFTIPSLELAHLHLSVARVLQGVIDGNEKCMFSIADHLNRASQVLITDEDKLDCGQYNLLATNLAIGKSAYNLAAEYACHGLAQLDVTTKWSEYYYQLSLNLHCQAADAYYSCGNIEQCNEHLEEVFQNARNVNDSYRAYHIKVCSLGAQARLDEAIDVAFAVARDLGLKLPKKMNMRNAIWQIAKTKMMLRGKTDEQLLALPDEANKSTNVYQAMALLGMATHYASLALKIPYLCIGIVTMLQMSIKGQGANASSSFASYGLLAAAMRDIPEAVRMGRLSLQCESQEGRHMSLNLSHTFLLHWRVPFHESLEALTQAYHHGMDAGDFDTVFMANYNLNIMAFCCGCRLVNLEEQMRACCTQMFEFDNMSHICVALPYWQLFLNLLAENGYPTTLRGEAMDGKTLAQEGRAAQVTVAPQAINAVRIFLCYLFEETSSLKSLLAEYEGCGSPHVGHFMHYMLRFYVGLSYIAVYRKFAKHFYKQKALKIIKEMRKWTRDGCINTKPLLSLLEAEMVTLGNSRAGGVFQNAKRAFNQAIDDANEFQNIGLTALANERAAHCFASYIPDQPESTVNIKRALELYKDWGAVAKIKHLKEKHGELLNSVSRQTPPVEIVDIDVS